MSRRPRGFTFPELLAVLCIVVLLLATFVPYALALRETNNRVGCVSNLNKIWWALTQYQDANGHSYPRTRFDEHLGNRWTAFTGADDADPFAASSQVRPNDVSAALWLLVRTVDARPEWFVCPSSNGTVDRVSNAAGTRVAARDRGNFRGAEHLTYAIASPYSAVSDYALIDTMPSTFVLVADQGPSIEMLASGKVPRNDAPARALALGNSVNHRRAGQNVLYASGTVMFEATPYTGVRPPASATMPATRPVPGDNIYTALAPAPLVDARPPHAEPGVAGLTVGPSYRYDTYLVPGADFVAAAAAESALQKELDDSRASSRDASPLTRPAAGGEPVLARVANPTTMILTTPPASAPSTAPATTQAAP